MQKINVISIVIRHLKTLSHDDGSLVWSDLLTFYLIPVVAGAAFFYFNWRVPKDAVALSISVFSIFAALLLSVQVALYSVSLRALPVPEDPKERTAFKGRVAIRSTVMRELNDNIAYLVLLSVVWVTALLALFVTSCHGRVASALVLAMYVHFFLTLLMVVKRSGIVFSGEYER